MNLSDGSSTATAVPATSTNSRSTTSHSSVKTTSSMDSSHIASRSQATNTPSATSQTVAAAHTLASAIHRKPSDSAMIGAGVGAGVGGTVVMLAIMAYCLTCRRQKKNKALAEQRRANRSSVHMGKPATIDSSPVQHTHGTDSPSTLVELESPSVPTFRLDDAPSTPPGAPFELGAKPYERCELPGDLPSELPGTLFQYGGFELKRQPSTKYQKLRSVKSTLPRMRTAGFTAWRPPAELETPPPSDARPMLTPPPIPVKSEKRGSVSSCGDSIGTDRDFTTRA